MKMDRRKRMLTMRDRYGIGGPIERKKKKSYKVDGDRLNYEGLTDISPQVCGQIPICQTKFS